MPHELRGSGGAVGITIGVAVPYQAAAPVDAQPIESFEKARDAVVARLQSIAERVRGEGRADEAGIFEAQAMMALDPSLQEQVRAAQEQGAALPEAITTATNSMRAVLEALDDPYLRERGADIGAVGTMLVQAAHGVTQSTLAELPPGAIVIAPDLTPAETVELPRERLAGFVTAFGGPTGHTAILARSLGIPAVVGVGQAALDIAAGTPLILDGGASLVLIDPDSATRADYEGRRAALEQARERQRGLIDRPGATADGHRVALWANIGRPEEAEAARAAGAEGIGLFRTEFLFLDRAQAPNEDEQFVAYRSVLQTMDGRTVVARTLDIGGDKPLPYLAMRPEANPFLGVRGLRFGMAHLELFHTQLRALLRAAAYGDVWIMLPMVATLDDLAWGRVQLRAVADELQAAGVEHRADVKLGIMIETPAAAVAADHFAREADFFSIGSNDLTQYTLAADRGDGELARRYTSDNVAVWRLIEQTIRAAKQAAIPVGVCGDMAGHEEYAVALTGLGIDELSMAPSALLPVREHLAQTTLADAQTLAHKRLA